MKKILSFVTLAIASSPALADVLPGPPPGRIGLAALVLVAVLAIAGFGLMRRKRGR